MEASYRRFVRSSLAEGDEAEISEVDRLAGLVKVHLDEQADAIDEAHVHRASSGAIQSIVSRLLREQLDFGEERILTPEHRFVTQARPDFFYRLGESRGILAEVERGGTTTNNHDLKDLWKAHISPDTQHLFLIVPHANWNEAGAPRERPYVRVVNRLGAFFGDPRKEVDVLSLHVFGYGRRDWVEGMSTRSIGLSEALNAYVAGHSMLPDDVLLDLAAETAVLSESNMQIAPEEGAFLRLMARLVGARSAVEVGTFTGYSSICIARGLADGGRLLCCDVSEEWTSVARRYWARAGLDDHIDLVIAPAVETLSALPTEPTIDLVFIDADKGGYPAYWRELVPRVRPGGVLLIDNVLRGGTVADDDPAAADMRAFNDMVSADARVEVVMLPLADGVTVAVRR